MRIFTYNTYIHVPISLLAFVACLLFPAVYYVDETKQLGYYLSFFLLLIGWVGIPIGYSLCWLANIFYIIGIMTLLDLEISFVFSFLASIFALSFLGHKKIIDPFYWSLAPIAKYGLGYYLWLASFIIFWLGQSLLLLNQSRK